jgi:hypothetical protein
MGKRKPDRLPPKAAGIRHELSLNAAFDCGHCSQSDAIVANHPRTSPRVPLSANRTAVIFSTACLLSHRLILYLGGAFHK